MAETTDIVTQVTATPALVFSDAKVAEGLLTQIRAEIAAFQYDLSTITGRERIASLAYKVARTKTAIDAAGAALIEDANKRVKTVNVERKRFRDTLDDLRDLARKPLDDWTAAEDLRIATANELIANLKRSGVVTLQDTSADVRKRLMALNATVLDEAVLGEFFVAATTEKARAAEQLQTSYTRLVKDEADRAELKRLQDAEVERKALAAETARKAQEAEAEAAAVKRREEEAAAAEERRLADVAKAAEAAAVTARADAAAAAQRQIDAANAETERLRLEAYDRDRDEAEAENAKWDREADMAHRQAVLDKITLAVLGVTGLSKIAAAKLVLNIAAGNIPGLKVEF